MKAKRAGFDVRQSHCTQSESCLKKDVGRL